MEGLCLRQLLTSSSSVKNRGGNIWIGLDSAVAVGHPAPCPWLYLHSSLMVLFALLLQPVGNQTPAICRLLLLAPTCSQSCSSWVCKWVGRFPRPDHRHCFRHHRPADLHRSCSTHHTARNSGWLSTSQLCRHRRFPITVLSDGGSPLSGHSRFQHQPNRWRCSNRRIACALAVWTVAQGGCCNARGSLVEA